MVKKAEKKGGGRLNRTQTVTLRLDPRLRYLTDLAARTQRRTTSGFIEWAIESALHLIVLKPGADSSTTLADEASSLWDIEEADRFVMLAIKYPHLLTHDEQVVWKLISENLAFWKEVYKNDPTRPNLHLGSIDLKVLRVHWEELKSISEGKGDPSSIPTTRKDVKVYDPDNIDMPVKPWKVLDQS